MININVRVSQGARIISVLIITCCLPLLMYAQPSPYELDLRFIDKDSQVVHPEKIEITVINISSYDKPLKTSKTSSRAEAGHIVRSPDNPTIYLVSRYFLNFAYEVQVTATHKGIKTTAHIITWGKYNNWIVEIKLENGHYAYISKRDSTGSRVWERYKVNKKFTLFKNAVENIDCNDTAIYFSDVPDPAVPQQYFLHSTIARLPTSITKVHSGLTIKASRPLGYLRVSHFNGKSECQLIPYSDSYIKLVDEK